MSGLAMAALTESDLDGDSAAKTAVQWDKLTVDKTAATWDVS